MPRKKTSKKLDLDKIERIASYEPAKSYQSLFYGVLTVIAIFILVFFGIRLIQQRTVPTIGEDGIQTSDISSNTYTVKPGDTLWSIAEKQYKDGFKWVEIAKLNNITNTDEIETGLKLKLPNLAVKAPQKTTTTQTQVVSITPTKVATPTQPATTPTIDQKQISDVGPKISGNTYTVVRGDNLWNIAIRAYGDGFRWVDIARANKLANPDLIHAGNKFIIPR